MTDSRKAPGRMEGSIPVNAGGTYCVLSIISPLLRSMLFRTDAGNVDLRCGSKLDEYGFVE